MKIFISSLFFATLLAFVNSTVETDNEKQPPAILIATLIRNKAHILPYFFTFLENLDYPKERLGLWLRSDYNEDKSIQITDTWLNKTQSQYHTVNKKFRLENARRRTESTTSDWPYERLSHVMNLKEEALNFARKNWYDYVLLLDADVLLTNAKALQELTKLDLPVVAPMLQSELGYSNFWNLVETDYSKAWPTDYYPMIERKKLGDFTVDAVTNAVLIDLNVVNSDGLTFDKRVLNSMAKQKGHYYDGPLDADIIFATSAKRADVQIYVSNIQKYGYVLPPITDGRTMESEFESLSNILVNALDDTGKLDIDPALEHFIKLRKPDTLGFSHIYVINLDRRQERMKRCEKLFKLVGLEAERVAAIDGQTLTSEFLQKHNISQLPAYKDPHGKKSMTFGEIGCFLSHYTIWQKMINLNLEKVLILEDDVKFRNSFRKKTRKIFRDLQETKKPWDVIYLGKRPLKRPTKKVKGIDNVYEATYGYWTLAYVLTLDGAKKLVGANPLQKLIPVDEYMQVMANNHKNHDYNRAYGKTDLISLDVYPGVAQPLRYINEPGFVSDTEKSTAAPKY